MPHRRSEQTSPNPSNLQRTPSGTRHPAPTEGLSTTRPASRPGAGDGDATARFAAEAVVSGAHADRHAAERRIGRRGTEARARRRRRCTRRRRELAGSAGLACGTGRVRVAEGLPDRAGVRAAAVRLVPARASRSAAAPGHAGGLPVAAVATHEPATARGAGRPAALPLGKAKVVDAPLPAVASGRPAPAVRAAAASVAGGNHGKRNEENHQRRRAIHFARPRFRRATSARSAAISWLWIWMAATAMLTYP